MKDISRQIASFDSPQVQTVEGGRLKITNAPREWILFRVLEAVERYLPTGWLASQVTEKKVTEVRWQTIDKDHHSIGTLDCLVRVKCHPDGYGMNALYRLFVNFSTSGDASEWWGFAERLPENIGLKLPEAFLQLQPKRTDHAELITGFRFTLDTSG